MPSTTPRPRGETEREPASTLERVLRAGKFAVTAEIVPPKVPSLNAVTKKSGHAP